MKHPQTLIHTTKTISKTCTKIHAKIVKERKWEERKKEHGNHEEEKEN